MKERLLILAGALAFSGFAAAQAPSYECVNGASTRRVEVAFPAAGETRCEVRYYKDGASQVLWSADVESGYCETKARDFIAKLQDAGWSCSNADAGERCRKRATTRTCSARDPKPTKTDRHGHCAEPAVGAARSISATVSLIAA